MEAIRNKKAYFNYEILETFEAGLKLLGHEVKSIKSGKASFAGSFVTFKDNDTFWVGGTIAPYQPKNTPESYNPTQPRKLLLTKKEVDYLRGRSKEGGLTVLPLRIFIKNSKLKMEIGLARHKKQWDKRETLKKRAQKRDIEREIGGKY